MLICSIYSEAADAFDPLSLNPSLWLDARYGTQFYDASTSNYRTAQQGEAVARWLDKTGNGGHASAVSLQGRPLLQPNGIVFDGANNGLIGNVAINSNQITIVMRFTLGAYNNGAYSRVLSFAPSTADDYQTSGSALIYSDESNIYSFRQTERLSLPNPNRGTIATFCASFADTYASLKIDDSGAERNDLTSNHFSIARYGVACNQGGGESISMIVGELLIFDKQLSENQLQKTIDYISR